MASPPPQAPHTFQCAQPYSFKFHEFSLLPLQQMCRPRLVSVIQVFFFSLFVLCCCCWLLLLLLVFVGVFFGGVSGLSHLTWVHNK